MDGQSLSTKSRWAIDHATALAPMVRLAKWEKQWPHIISHRFADSGHYILEDSFEDVRAKVEPFLFANE
ncbi:hypothetical protein OAU80_02510 [Opitutales bacterium]|nr:hypothetical protein [Opitutales bacterium]